MNKQMTGEHRWKQISEDEVACMDCGVEPWMRDVAVCLGPHPDIVAAQRDALLEPQCWRDIATTAIVLALVLTPWALIATGVWWVVRR